MGYNHLSISEGRAEKKNLNPNMLKGKIGEKTSTDTHTNTEEGDQKKKKMNYLIF